MPFPSPTPTRTVTPAASSTVTPSLSVTPSITPTTSHTPQPTPTVTPSLDRNNLNVQVVPNIPQMINGPNGTSIMNPQWVQYFRTVNSRIGGQPSTKLLSNNGSGTTLEFIAGAGITVVQTDDSLTVSSDIPFTTVEAGAGILVNITNDILTITNDGVINFSLEDISTLPIFSTAPSVPAIGDVVSTIQLNIQPANSIFAGPLTGFDQPNFRLLDISDFSTIVFPVENGGTGNSTIPTNGQILIGDGSTFQLNTIAQGTGINITNAAGEISIALGNTTVTAGVYTSANITVDSQGRITSAANGTAGTVTSVGITPGTGISVSGSPITSSGSITVSNGGVITLAGTTNEILVNTSTGAVIVSLPPNIVVPTPSTGWSLSLTGASLTPALHILSGSSGTGQGADLWIDRASTTINSYAEGANIFFQDVALTTGTLIQHAGGQTEIWQSITGGGTGQVLAFTVNGYPSFPKANTTASAANAFLDSTSTSANQLLRSTSSIRYKDNVLNITKEAADNIFKLQSVTYTSKCANDDPSLKWYGFIAEQVAEIEPRLVDWSKDDQGKLVPESVMYERITVLLVDVVKRLNDRVEKLENK